MLTTIALADFNARLTTAADTLLKETGDPNLLTRHAIGVKDGQITFIFDTVDGPTAGGTELMDVVIFPNGDMLVTSQFYTADVRLLINGDTIDAIGKAVYAKYVATGGAKFSALGDPELDDKHGVFHYTENGGDKYVVKGVGNEMKGCAIDEKGDKSIAYMGGDLLLVSTADLMDVLRENALSSIRTKALVTKPIGKGAKMARVATLELDGEEKKVWAYVDKNGEGQMTKFYLDYESLVLVATQPFKGTYATTSADGKDMILVRHLIEEGADEKFQIKRHDLPGFTADAIAA